MVFITKKMENVMSMYDERVAELESLLEASDARYAEAKARLDREVTLLVTREERYVKETNILAGILNYTYANCGLEKHHLDAAMDESTYTALEIRNVLSYHEAVPEDMLTREYSVTVTLPITIHLTVEATDEDDAEEKATSKLECDGLDYYDVEYDLCYNAEFEIEEM